MSNLGSRSSSDTTPFESPQSPLPEATLNRRQCHRFLRRENSPGTSLPNPYEETHSDQTLEGAFSRLNIDWTSTDPHLYSGLEGGVPNGIGGEPLFSCSFPQRNREFQRLSLPNDVSGNFGHGHMGGLQDYCVGSDMNGLECFLSNPYSHNITEQSLNLNNGFLIDSRRFRLHGEGFNGEIPISPSSNANELSCDFLGDYYGEIGGLVYKNSNISRHDVDNRRPHWLQEPLDCLSVEYLRGRIVSMAKDQYGCRILQRTMESSTNEEINIIFLEVIEHVGDLMIDPYGNYVVQKLVELCNEEQRTHILLVLTRIDFRLVTICLNMHGTRAVQKLLESLTKGHQISIVMKALGPGAVALTKSTNGHHVIQYCLKNFSEKDNEYLLNEVVDNCYGIATDKSGCCVLQQCIKYSQGELRELLVAEIVTNAMLLAEDRYGNYVVQYLLDLRIPQVTASILRQLKGSFSSLSCNKYGSNVVEKCLLVTGPDQSALIIMELITSPNPSMLLLDPYGNYVIQSALSVSKGIIHKALENLVQMNSPMMRSNLYGKKVLAWFDKRKGCNMYKHM
ncbi:putative pumilio homolog 8, chloroplastic isoform X2 [Ziziphus jujuba]|uniref:Pumilio homolog 8, chloroplastic isoform X2 n=1 Tax=Ziziphus jujuba TaxID=326968 RepID=A0A6P3ZU94_ZIZJJ|nr:putative pumilio homolog 8, chloroplastic isoform X2 [Ziziphus jujuba]